MPRVQIQCVWGACQHCAACMPCHDVRRKCCMCGCMQEPILSMAAMRAGARPAASRSASPCGHTPHSQPAHAAASPAQPPATPMGHTPAARPTQLPSLTPATGCAQPAQAQDRARIISSPSPESAADRNPCAQQAACTTVSLPAAAADVVALGVAAQDARAAVQPDSHLRPARASTAFMDLTGDEVHHTSHHAVTAVVLDLTEDEEQQPFPCNLSSAPLVPIPAGAQQTQSPFRAPRSDASPTLSEHAAPLQDQLGAASQEAGPAPSMPHAAAWQLAGAADLGSVAAAPPSTPAAAAAGSVHEQGDTTPMPAASELRTYPRAVSNLNAATAQPDAGTPVQSVAAANNHVTPQEQVAAPLPPKKGTTMSCKRTRFRRRVNDHGRTALYYPRPKRRKQDQPAKGPEPEAPAVHPMAAEASTTKMVWSLAAANHQLWQHNGVAGCTCHVQNIMPTSSCINQTGM